MKLFLIKYFIEGDYYESLVKAWGKDHAFVVLIRKKNIGIYESPTIVEIVEISMDEPDLIFTRST